MPSGFTVNGVDLDSIFKARVSAKGADIGLQVGGVDIANRYEVSTGGDQLVNPTGFKVGGIDLKSRFRDFNFVPAQPLSLGVDNSAPSASGMGNGPFTTAAVTATPMGGTPGYTYAWARQSGDASISISSSTAAAPAWTASGTAQQTKSAVWRCTVTDSLGATATADVTVSIVFNGSNLAVSLNTGGTGGGRGGSGVVMSGSVTGTPTGGSAPYSYLWIQISGDGGTSAVSATAATSTFTRTGVAGNTYTSYWQLRVTDNAGSVVFSSTLTVTLACV